MLTHTQGLPLISSHLHADSVSLEPSDMGLGKRLLVGDHPVKGYGLRHVLQMRSRLCGVSRLVSKDYSGAPSGCPFGSIEARIKETAYVVMC